TSVLAYGPLHALDVLDRVALGEGHDRLLPAGRLTARPAVPVLWARATHRRRVHVLHGHGEGALHRFLDLRLVRGQRDLEDVLVLPGQRRALFRHHRATEHLVRV